MTASFPLNEATNGIFSTFCFAFRFANGYAFRFAYGYAFRFAYGYAFRLTFRSQKPFNRRHLFLHVVALLSIWSKPFHSGGDLHHTIYCGRKRQERRIRLHLVEKPRRIVRIADALRNGP